jgi:uncharacterized membrane protein
MYRKSLAAAAAAVLLAATAAQARHPEARRGPPIAKIATMGVELTADQSEMLGSIRETAKERGSFSDDVGMSARRGRGEWMAGYLRGEMDRDEVLGGIEEQMDERSGIHQESAALWLGLLATYDEGQRSQVMENIDEMKMRHGENSADRSAEGRRGPPIERLLDGVELSRKQEKSIDRLLEDQRQARKGALESHREHRMQWMDDFAAGKLDTDEISAELESRSEEAVESRLQATRDWIDLIDSLDVEQKEKLLENLEELQSSRGRPSRNERTRHPRR